MVNCSPGLVSTLHHMVPAACTAGGAAGRRLWWSDPCRKGRRAHDLTGPLLPVAALESGPAPLWLWRRRRMQMLAFSTTPARTICTHTYTGKPPLTFQPTASMANNNANACQCTLRVYHKQHAAQVGGKERGGT